MKILMIPGISGRSTVTSPRIWGSHLPIQASPWRIGTYQPTNPRVLCLWEPLHSIYHGDSPRWLGTTCHLRYSKKNLQSWAVVGILGYFTILLGPIYYVLVLVGLVFRALDSEIQWWDVPFFRDFSSSPRRIEPFQPDSWSSRLLGIRDESYGQFNPSTT